MAFVVEDGTGLTNSTSYCSVLFFKSHFDDVGDSETSNRPDADIEMSLIKGTRYLDRRYRGVLLGYKTKRDQALQFPRSGLSEDGYAIPNYIVPDNWKRACCEAAKISFDIDLFASIDGDSGGVIEETLGPITTKWSVGSNAATAYYPSIESYVAGYVSATGGMIEAIR